MTLRHLALGSGIIAGAVAAVNIGASAAAAQRAITTQPIVVSGIAASTAPTQHAYTTQSLVVAGPTDRRHGSTSMNALIASLALAVTSIAQPTVFAPVAGDDDTFTFTVPVQISNIRVPLRQPVVACSVATGTSVSLGGQSGGRSRYETFMPAANADGSPGRILGEGHTAVPATSTSYTGNVVVVVRARTAPGMAPHSYACALMTEYGPLRNRADGRDGSGLQRGAPEYDPATFRPLVGGTIQ